MLQESDQQICHIEWILHDPSALQTVTALTDGKESNQLKSPPGWVLASQWGMTLVVATCIFGYLGYWIGQQLGNQAASFFLGLTGLLVGFGLGLFRMIKATERLAEGSQSDHSANNSEGTRKS